MFWWLMKKINFWLWAGWVASYLQRSLSAQVNGGSRCHPDLWKQLLVSTYWTDIMYMTKLPWWRHQMETFSALLAFCAGNSPEFSTQRPVTRSFDVFFHLHLNKQLSKQPRGWQFETPSGSLWHQCDGNITISFLYASIVVLRSLSSKHYNLLSDNFYCNLYEKTVITQLLILNIWYFTHKNANIQNSLLKYWKQIFQISSNLTT